MKLTGTKTEVEISEEELRAQLADQGYEVLLRRKTKIPLQSGGKVPFLIGGFSEVTNCYIGLCCGVKVELPIDAVEAHFIPDELVYAYEELYTNSQNVVVAGTTNEEDGNFFKSRDKIRDIKSRRAGK